MTKAPVLVASFLAAACGGQEVLVELQFPSRQPFYFTETVRVLTIDIFPHESGLCPSLRELAERNAIDADSISSDSTALPVCAFADAAVPDVSAGTKAYVAVALDETGRVLLSGCEIRDWDAAEEPLVIELFTTEVYRREHPPGSAGPACASIEEKCNGDC